MIDADTSAAISGAIVSIGRPAGVQPPPGAPLLPTKMLTDSSGRFFFDSLPAGGYTITATKSGFLPGAYGSRRPGGAGLTLDLAEGSKRVDLMIPLWRYAVIAGRAVDDANEPLTGLGVRAARVTYIAGHRTPTFAARVFTDDRGAYRFANLPPGDYVIYVPATVTTEPAGAPLGGRGGATQAQSYLQTMTGLGTAPMSFDRPTMAVAGGAIVVGSLLTVPVAPSSTSSTSSWMTYPTTLSPASTTLAGATVVHAESGRERAGVDLVVRTTPTFQISGVVAGPDGPAAFHAVHLLQPDSADAPLFDVATAVTDAAGAFVLYGVPSGQYVARVVRTQWPTGPERRLAVTAGGATPSVAIVTGSAGPPAVSDEPVLHASQPVTVADTAVRNLSLTLRAGPRLAGRAEFDGNAPRPVADQWQGVYVNLERANGQPASGMFPGQFAADGSFTMPSTWPSKYLIRVKGAPPGWTLKGATWQGREIAETPFDLTADMMDIVITFTDHPTSVSGTVRDSAGHAVPGAQALLFPTDRTHWVDYGISSRVVRSAAATASGSFVISGVPDGEYFLIAIGDEQAADWQNPEFLAIAAGSAERIVIRGQTVNQALRLRSISR
jgi:hypothetical protein